jgi:UDP-N-acetylglucosamine 2-epimerase (non-hydrolysing)
MYELLLRLNLQNNDSEVKNNRIFCTIHRSQNTDTPERLSLIIKKLSNSSIPIDLFAHPRLLARIKQFEIKIDERRIRIKSPVSYLKTIDLLKKYSGVITDSGGLQKEAFFLSVPCLTIRAETEWPETLKNNWNRLDNDLMFINENWWEQLKNKENINEFGGKDTSKIILSRLLNS